MLLHGRDIFIKRYPLIRARYHCQNHRTHTRRTTCSSGGMGEVICTESPDTVVEKTWAEEPKPSRVSNDSDRLVSPSSGSREGKWPGQNVPRQVTIVGLTRQQTYQNHIVDRCRLSKKWGDYMRTKMAELTCNGPGPSTALPMDPRQVDVRHPSGGRYKKERDVPDSLSHLHTGTLNPPWRAQICITYYQSKRVFYST